MAELRQDQIEKARTIFDKYDKDHSGTIDAKEFTTIVKELKVFENESLLDVYVPMTFKKMDKDGSGSIDWNEFLNLYKTLLQNKVK